MKRIAYLFFLIIFLVQLNAAQPNSSELKEEQDYAFSTGLFEDKLYQLSFEQLQKFLDQYPNSLKR
ncbi:MAG: hypothetical protein PHP42_03305, partial [Bacteroidota bacterium]|nr:hypothetical protein [Bacteroidota bacterium]